MDSVTSEVRDGSHSQCKYSTAKDVRHTLNYRIFAGWIVLFETIDLMLSYYIGNFSKFQLTQCANDRQMFISVPNAAYCVAY